MQWHLRSVLAVMNMSLMERDTSISSDDMSGFNVSAVAIARRRI